MNAHCDEFSNHHPAEQLHEGQTIQALCAKDAGSGSNIFQQVMHVSFAKR